MLSRLNLERTDGSEERIASIIRGTRSCEVGTTLAVTRHRGTLRRNTIELVLVFLRGVLRMLVTADGPTSPILVTLTMEAIRSSETSVLTGAT
jgi:hypothetical protein